jgi:ABC-type bacteriocin/lantibiotic exporter with double-glycine peptidase domain
MLKKILCLVLVGSTVILTSGRPALAANTKENEVALTQKVKAAIAKLGTGPSAQVEITLRDKTKLQGYILKANEEHFIVVHEKTGATTEVAYPEVKKVKGHNLSTGAKVGIGVAIAVVALILIFKDHINAY